MFDKLVVAGVVVLAGWLAAVSPVAAFGRGGGGSMGSFRGGSMGSFHRPVGPAFRRVIMHRPVRPMAVPANAVRNLAVQVSVHDVEPLRRLAFRHSHAPFAIGVPITTITGSSDDVSPPAPADNPVADEDAAGPPHAAAVSDQPACQEQEYRVPDRSGERRSVRVVRC